MVKEYNNFEIVYKEAKKDDFIWDLPFLKIKNEILGKDFVANLNFIKNEEAKNLNIQNRNKDYYPNVLTFPLDDKCGEIYICKSVAKMQYKDFDMSYKNYIIFLFIHGCLHLKGTHHDTTENEKNMVRLEYEFLGKYKR